MKYNILGKTGLKVSAIGIGAWQLGGPLELDGKQDAHPFLDKKDVSSLIHYCEAEGINLIDTAEQYGAGESERRVGEALKGRREKWHIVTKFGARVGENGERINDPSASSIELSCENSLKRLKTDYIDVYLYHVLPKKEEILAGKEVLEKLKKEGKIRFYGLSINSVPSVELFLKNDAIDCLQFNRSILTNQEDLYRLVKDNNLGAMTRGTFANGLLSGKYFHQPPVFKEGDYRNGKFSAEDYAKYSVFEDLVPQEMTMSEMAIRYVLDFEITHTLLLGGKSKKDYETAFRAVDFPPLSNDLHLKLDSLRRRLNSLR